MSQKDSVPADGSAAGMGHAQHDTGPTTALQRRKSLKCARDRDLDTLLRARAALVRGSGALDGGAPMIPVVGDDTGNEGAGPHLGRVDRLDFGGDLVRDAIDDVVRHASLHGIPQRLRNIADEVESILRFTDSGHLSPAATAQLVRMVLKTHNNDKEN